MSSSPTFLLFRAASPALVLLIFGGIGWADSGEQSPTTSDSHEPSIYFDEGGSLDQWMTLDGSSVDDCWQLRNRVLTFEQPSSDTRDHSIVSRKRFEDFELDVEWSLEAGGNSGIKYKVFTSAGDVIGCEYQFLDDDRHPNGRNPLTRCGAIYGIVPPNESGKKLLPVGQFNHTRIVVRGSRIEHWLNGNKIVDVDTSTEDWRRRVMRSKFCDAPQFGRLEKGRLMLQDHDSRVSFRNLRVRSLSRDERRQLADLPPVEKPLPKQPNVVLVVVRDLSKDLVGCYGGSIAQTPNLNSLAERGLRLELPFVPTASSRANRWCLISGQVSMESSDALDVTPLDQAHVLDELSACGYQLGRLALGPSHNPNLPENGSDAFAWCGDEANLAEFFQQTEERPYFLMADIRDACRPFQRQVSAPHLTLRCALPKFLADTPENRQEFAAYATAVEAADERVGQLINELEQQAALSHTVLIVTSDGGMPFPRSKGTTYDAGVAVPLIVCWPSVVSPASVHLGLASVADIAPTIVELAGGRVEECSTGESLVPVLRDPRYPSHHWLYIQDLVENHFECTTVRSEDIKLIARPQLSANSINENQNKLTGKELSESRQARLASARDGALNARRTDGKSWELYNLHDDPAETHNLAADPDWANTKKQAAARLRQHSTSQ